MFTDKNILIGLSGSQKLTKLIAKHLKTTPAKTLIKHFADGETMVKPEVPVRHKNVFIIQATSKPVNENIMELLIAIDAFRRASAKTINVIIPYYGYARQDRKTLGREPITSKLVADLIVKAGATRVCIVDVHADQIQGFFEIPVDTISASYMLVGSILKEKSKKNTVIVSPDYGGVKRARRISVEYNLPMAILDKRRPKPNVAEITNVLGDIKNKDCIILDDIIDTGGTIIAACNILKRKGARSIIVGASHGVFSNYASNKFQQAIKNKIIEHIFISNSIDNVYNLKIKNLKIVDISKFLAKIIQVYTLASSGSISKIYSKAKH